MAKQIKQVTYFCVYSGISTNCQSQAHEALCFIALLADSKDQDSLGLGKTDNYGGRELPLKIFRFLEIGFEIFF